MKELCIPIPELQANQVAEVTVTIAEKEIAYQFRLESFPWTSDENVMHKFEDESLAKIHTLKKTIAEYDKSWELIQIFTPSEKSKFIQILYRKRK